MLGAGLYGVGGGKLAPGRKFPLPEGSPCNEGQDAMPKVTAGSFHISDYPSLVIHVTTAHLTNGMFHKTVAMASPPKTPQTNGRY